MKIKQEAEVIVRHKLPGWQVAEEYLNLLKREEMLEDTLRYMIVDWSGIDLYADYELLPEDIKGAIMALPEIKRPYARKAG